jgi:nicotinamidase-related amidase
MLELITWLVIYSLTRNAALSDIREEVAPVGDEPTVKSGPDKFFNTNLESTLANNGIKTLILVGASAHGAVLNTAIGAALRNFHVIVPVDGISATEPYAEQYTIWHLSNVPSCRGRVTITTVDLIQFQESPC